jgi:hypothetical protein
MSDTDKPASVRVKLPKLAPNASAHAADALQREILARAAKADAAAADQAERRRLFEQG